MEVDYLIIGAGLAGIGFAETALQNNKSVFVFDNNSQNSSKVAAGLYNPVILKRFSGLNNAQYQIDLLNFFYANVESKLNIKIDYKIPILRKFFSIEEQNNWFIASDKPDLVPFLSLDLISKKYNGIDSPFGYGQVLQTGYVDTAFYIESYKNYLSENNFFSQESFNYSELSIFENQVVYKNIFAKNIIFAEGFGMHANPFFKHLPLDGTKGELFIIKAPKLDNYEHQRFYIAFGK
jgi:glycine oxidase